MAAVGENKRQILKILVIGDNGVGKTSFIKRYTQRYFSDHYKATIGVDFALKELDWDANTKIQLQFWDLEGQDRIRRMTRVYYKGAHGAFVVFDVAAPKTLDSVPDWKQDLDTKVFLDDGRNIPTVLLANKCDIMKKGLANDSKKMDDFCKDRGFVEWFEVSAKENYNINEANRFLVSAILDAETSTKERQISATVNLNCESDSQTNKCC